MRYVEQLVNSSSFAGFKLILRSIGAFFSFGEFRVSSHKVIENVTINVHSTIYYNVCYANVINGRTRL